MKTSALRFSWLLALAPLVAACGGSSAPSAGPTAPPPAMAPPAAAPRPPVQPQFPDVLGAWVGTTTISASVDGRQESRVCNESWSITAQSSGAFSGSFRSSGAEGSCDRTGLVNAVITPDGGVTELVHSAPIGTDAACTKMNATPYSGMISTDGLSFNAVATDRLMCRSGASSVSASRRIVVTMSKR